MKDKVSPKKLTIGEFQERARKNPNDPEVQKFSKDLLDIYRRFIPSQNELHQIQEGFKSLQQSAVQFKNLIPEIKENSRKIINLINSHGVPASISKIHENQFWQVQLPSISYVPVQGNNIEELIAIRRNQERIIELFESNSSKNGFNITAEQLLAEVPLTKRYKNVLDIGKRIIHDKSVKNYALVRIIYPNIKNLKDYEKRKKQYLKALGNCIRTLRKFLVRNNFTIKMRAKKGDFCELIKLK
ncbi:hypothetical protein A3C23_04620 [Candidatus Roizmanbacteria bacterium RIFCSPHIGHO2_02_FULL_37_13b]|uniref:Uncharacterized protein n=1 Tax=Candidatus Roizmanbacteria bacterium RIFCSPLOWO2_02_FULL_36_11 TaxID=1802071 RepID=A0A1F7JHB8_9BACT|nr:MAG: hypothetical protein A3C23_04620 [Candidatus Roizmanbacteria bacterium RIFCSPHIGHO2_02_FULL_37_13b]OGK54992.1 MAG: hypothetical protein A3H78_00765 [Candidatus Roizmanbacteria bacterium RIFCSPLOWO2_02_FULL_36_11]